MVRGWSRRSVLAGSGLFVGGLAGCVVSNAESHVVREGFEDGLGEWKTGADVPMDPNTPGSPVAWSIDRTTVRANGGQASLRLVLDGRQDEGTIWIVRPISVTQGYSYEVAGRCVVWSGSESFNTLAHLVMYVGQTPPETEASFPPPGTDSTGTTGTIGGLREPVNQAAGWRPYSFTWETHRLESDTMYIAIGVSVVWETEIEYGIDDVVIRFDPQ